jgi:DNA helicase-2/ATP-dependent DNA helicase PcrA
LDELGLDLKEKDQIQESSHFQNKANKQWSRKFKQSPIKKSPTKVFVKPIPKKSNFTSVDLSSFTADDTSKLQSGMNILHQKFGNGKVLSIDGNDNNRIANIFFPDSGQKKIMLKYAKLQIIT